MGLQYVDSDCPRIPVIVPPGLVTEFAKYSEMNYKMKEETCAYLFGSSELVRTPDGGDCTMDSASGIFIPYQSEADCTCQTSDDHNEAHLI